MSAQTMSEVFAPIMAKYRADVIAATWGHLAPCKRKTYQGYVLFAIPVYDSGTPCIIDADFEDLNDSPWLYDAMWDFASQTTQAGVYRFDGTFRNYNFDGTITKIATEAAANTEEGAGNAQG